MVNSIRLRCHYTELRRLDVTGIGRGHDCPGTTKTSTGKTRVGNRKKGREKKQIAACRHLFDSHTKYQTITTGNGGIMSVRVLRRDWAQRRRISCRTWVTKLCGILEVWKRVAQNENRKTKTKTETKTKTPPCTPGTKWCVSNGNMRHSKYARPQRSRFKFGQHLVTFSFYIYAGNQGRQQWSKFQFA